MTTTTAVDRSPAVLDSLFQALASERRRTILRLVVDRSETGLTREELASQLVVVANASSLGVINDDDRRHVRLTLVHRDLPALVDAGVLTMVDDGTVIEPEPVIEELGIGDAIATESADELDSVFEALADRRRRTALAVLAGTYQPLSTRALAADIAVYERDVTDGALSANEVDRVHTSLVHQHLPAFNDAGVVAYDEITGRVVYEGHPVIQQIKLAPDRPTTDDAAIALANE